MPNLESGKLDTLDSILVPSQSQTLSTRLRKKCKTASSIVSDVVEAPPDVHGPGQMTVFRLMHVSPKQQKLMRSPASSLRGDHVAVSVASIQSKSRSTRSMTVCGDRHGSTSSIRLISLASFLELGMERLKQAFLKVVLSPSVLYNFIGVSLDSACHSMAGQVALTTLVDANAVPAGDLFHMANASQDLLDMFKLFEAEGLVASFDNGQCWQLTARGVTSMRYSLHCVDFQRFYVPRLVPLVDRTEWDRRSIIIMCFIIIIIVIIINDSSSSSWFLHDSYMTSM